MKIVIGVNTLGQVEQQSYANHCQVWYNLGKRFPEHQFIFFAPQRMSIDRMRNATADVALEHEADYLVFLDDDVIIPMNFLSALLSSSFDVTSGITCVRGYPYYPMLFDFSNLDCHFVEKWKSRRGTVSGRTESTYKYKVEAPVDAVGFSLCLIKVDIIRALTKPYFMTGPNFTEDVYFCQKVRNELGIGKIGYRKDVLTSHILPGELIHPNDRKARKDFDEVLSPELKKKKAKSDDRGQDYYDQVKRVVANKKATKDES